jgi:hypothetical protein
MDFETMIQFLAKVRPDEFEEMLEYHAEDYRNSLTRWYRAKQEDAVRVLDNSVYPFD